MNDQCLHCTNEVKEGTDICTNCWEQIPAVFECHDCGQTCYKKDGDFGGWAKTDDSLADVPICSECAELAAEDVIATDRIDEYYQNSGFDWDEFDHQFEREF